MGVEKEKCTKVIKRYYGLYFGRQSVVRLKQ